MVEAITSVSSASTVKAVPATAQASTDDAAKNFAASIPASFENPRVVLDPSAGFITQYLSSNGSTVLSQTPNAVTVAYLRNGLQRDGTPKHPVESYV